MNAMGRKLDDQMQAAMLMVSVSDVPRFTSVIAAIKTLKCEEATWNFVSTRLLEESRTMQPQSLQTSSEGAVASAVNGNWKNNKSYRSERHNGKFKSKYKKHDNKHTNARVAMAIGSTKPGSMSTNSTTADSLQLAVDSGA
eukprot:IDg5379t1